jgi:uncharacterized protein YdhG (YjbR/CyaY superfamily)
MVGVSYGSVTEYIAAQPASARVALRKVRATIRKALPEAEEGISYRIPIYRVNGEMVVFFAGFKQHYSIYPATKHLVSALKKELRGHLFSKTIRFSFSDEVPTRLITRIVKIRAAEARARRKMN